MGGAQQRPCHGFVCFLGRFFSSGFTFFGVFFWFFTPRLFTCLKAHTLFCARRCPCAKGQHYDDPDQQTTKQHAHQDTPLKEIHAHYTRIRAFFFKKGRSIFCSGRADGEIGFQGLHIIHFDVFIHDGFILTAFAQLMQPFVKIITHLTTAKSRPIRRWLE